jgi:hypothetical protein
MKKILIALILLTFTSCENPVFFKKEYTVSGILYDTDEVTPVAGERLYLEGENFTNFQNYSKIIAETTTDENGYFVLTYIKNRKARTLDILNSNYKILLSSIPVNENYTRDICSKAVGYLDLTIHIERKLKETDTVIIHLSDAEPVTSHYDENKNYVLHPFDELQKFQHINTEWNRGITTQRLIARWGIGEKDLQENGLSGTGDIKIDPPNYKRFIIRGFPYTDTGSITIK